MVSFPPLQSLFVVQVLSISKYWYSYSVLGVVRTFTRSLVLKFPMAKSTGNDLVRRFLVSVYKSRLGGGRGEVEVCVRERERKGGFGDRRTTAT